MLPNPLPRQIPHLLMHEPIDVTHASCVVSNTQRGVEIRIIGGTPHLVAMATAIAPYLPEAEPEFIAERAAAILAACQVKLNEPDTEEPAMEENKSPIIAG